MPCGNTHSQIAFYGAVSLVAAGVTAPYFVKLGPFQPSYVEIGAGAIGVILGDLFMSPDLDQAFSNCKRRWWILGGIWHVYEWLPHRSPLSHCPGLSDAGRFIYLALPPALFALGVAIAIEGAQRAILDAFWVMYKAQAAMAPYWRESLALFLGNSFNTFLHVAADIYTKEDSKGIDGPEPRRKGGRPRKRTPASAPMSKKQVARLQREERRGPAGY